jgi:hypothetical protein
MHAVSDLGGLEGVFIGVLLQWVATGLMSGFTCQSLFVDKAYTNHTAFMWGLFFK